MHLQSPVQCLMSQQSSTWNGRQTVFEETPREKKFLYLPFGTGDLTNPPGLLPLGIVVLIYHMNWLPTCVQSVWKFLAVALSLKTGISEEIGFFAD